MKRKKGGKKSPKCGTSIAVLAVRLLRPCSDGWGVCLYFCQSVSVPLPDCKPSSICHLPSASFHTVCSWVHLLHSSGSKEFILIFFTIPPDLIGVGVVKDTVANEVIFLSKFFFYNFLFSVTLIFVAVWLSEE